MSKKPAPLNQPVKIKRSAFNSKLWAIFCTSFVVGAVLGILSLYMLTRHDCFTMMATADRKIDLVIGADEAMTDYVELGVNCVAFGKNISAKVNIAYFYREDITHDPKPVAAIDPNIDGVYYVVYTTDHWRYKNVQLIRNVFVCRKEN